MLTDGIAGSEAVFLDDDADLLKRGVVRGGISYAVQHKDEYDAIVGIGAAEIRKKIQEFYMREGVNVISVVHPSAELAWDVRLGRGTVIMAGAVVHTGTVIGDGCIINTASSVDHDNIIGDYCHIAVGCHLAGNVMVGANTWIGAGATVSNNVSICENVTVGAGAVVVKDIKEPGVYVGVPAKKLSREKKCIEMV